MQSEHSLPRDRLRRLDARMYRGLQAVHWTMTIQDRRTGWLTRDFHGQFREIMAHTTFRYGLCCPIYCCMPDHIHLLWMGLLEDSNQLVAMRGFRKYVNAILTGSGYLLQKQAYDHVLREEEREQSAFESVAGYIARNPERAKLVGEHQFHEYEFTGRVVPGYPELRLWEADSWPRFWRCYYHLRDTKMFRLT